MAKDFQGVIFDVMCQTIIERGPVLRGTYAEAMADAKALVKVVNDAVDDADSYDNYYADAVDCFILVDGVLVYSEVEA